MATLARAVVSTGAGAGATATATVTVAADGALPLMRAPGGAAAPVRQMAPVFVDLDQTLVDFSGGVVARTGRTPEAMRAEGSRGISEMWRAIAAPPEFFANLEWLPESRELFDFLSPHAPTVLTGLPAGTWAEPQKRRWCKRELGEHVPVLCCPAKDKAAVAAKALARARAASAANAFAAMGPLSLKGAVLIDDREEARDPWVGLGGVFILHVSARDSRLHLERLGYGGAAVSASVTVTAQHAGVGGGAGAPS